ncbi:MAG TPA: M14 metallopeptidase family protein [Blastocatellia bacterium]|nr:M14 metallopeptidase family protein [Blastocatellia bacterium]
MINLNQRRRDRAAAENRMRLINSTLICKRLALALFMLSAVAPLALVRAVAHAGQRARKTQAAATGNYAPTPRDVLGFAPGDDRKLASWAQMVDYFKQLDRASNRVMLEELGKTTLGRPFLLAVISSPANLARLDYYKDIQRKLADPRVINGGDAEAEKLIAEGKTIVLITCGIHSTEVGGNLVSMNIAHKLASDDSAETREVLDKCIVLLVPSLNPDGVDIVKGWYDKTLGTPAEGTGPPELYHHYTGHDNNRDWYAFTQVETRMTVDKAHNAWHPQIVHDIHQQGDSGSRFFIPPYVEPWEPNVPAIIQAGVNFMGSAMAWEMIAEGKAGVVINGVYDAWTPSRAYQHYHGGIRILSETASARIATPTTVPFERLTPQVGVNPKVRSWNYPLVWQGGEWRLADIVDYMQSGAFALLRNAARYRERWLRDFYRVGKDAVRERKPGEPFAFLIPAAQASRWQSDGLQRLTAILRRGGVEFIKAGSAFEAGGKQYPAGTIVIPMAQPYGAFAKTLLERQRYPDLREYPGGPPRRPYDVTAHTLPLLMGVGVAQVDRPFTLPKERQAGGPAGGADGAGPPPRPRVGLYKSYAASMDEGWTRWILDQYQKTGSSLNVPYKSLKDEEIRAGGLRAKYDCIVIPAQSSQSILNGLSKERYPAEISGGLGADGVGMLNRFIEDGGTVITLNEASNFAIAQLGVPVKNVLEGVPPKDFYCPGSILKIQFDASNPLAREAPTLDSTRDESIAWFETGPAFETTGKDARVVARFADAKELLLSGWLLGAEKIANKGAIVEVKRGKGRVIMFAFRPQYRGQSIATLPFFFNAILTSAQEQ